MVTILYSHLKNFFIFPLDNWIDPIIVPNNPAVKLSNSNPPEFDSKTIRYLQMEDFQKWNPQICCPDNYEENIPRFIKEKSPFTILNSKFISSVDF